MLLLLKFLLGVDVVLFGVQVVRTAQQGLLEGLHGRGIILLLQGYVATIIIIIRCMDRCARRFFQPFQGLPRLVISRLAVQGIRQVVVRREGRAVLQEGTPVIDIGLAPVFLAELAVSLPHFPPVRLGLGRRGRRTEISEGKIGKGEDFEKVCRAQDKVEAAFGRMEKIAVGNKYICILLVKNPVGLDRALSFVAGRVMPTH